MAALAAAGRWLFAIAVAAFGVQYLMYGQFRGGLPPVPPWVPYGSFLSYPVGVALLAAAVCIALPWRARTASLALGILFLFCAVALHTWHFSDLLHSGNDRTRVLETLALGAVALALAGMLRTGIRGGVRGGVSDEVRGAAVASGQRPANSRKLISTGRWLFAFTLLIFGWQHFLYAPFIATLIPGWIPAHLFMTYFTGVAMIAAGLAIAAEFLSKFLAYVAALAMAAMFLSWVLVLHAPRVAAALHNGDEWASLFVALAMGAGSLILATSFAPSLADRK